jgi:hypothetical protein
MNNLQGFEYFLEYLNSGFKIPYFHFLSKISGALQLKYIFLSEKNLTQLLQ